MKVLLGPNPMGLEKSLPNLKKEYPQVEFVYCAEQKDLADAITDADIYIGWLHSGHLLTAKKLKWIQAPSSGVDYYLNIPELVKRDIILTNARGTHSVCLAESALAMILAFTRGIRDATLRQQQRMWDFQEIRGKLVELTGSTMGIIGFGTVGRALAKRAQVFDMRIIAVDLYPADKPGYVSEFWGFDRLDDMLRESDYVVVTVPRTPQTLGMIGAEQLTLMKPSAMLVGISRGGIIDEKALAQALREKRLAAAALDVFETEPLPADSELWDIENLLITPHVAGGTQFETQYILDIFRENLERFMRGELPLRNQIDKQKGF
ncbi:D-2-hydroxyacid dehydrogenase [Candidatus Poribacteria bacterium]|nr:D-2-hydroxyacid dehydrogenase [Candidatus Poribacteria bacterium]